MSTVGLIARNDLRRQFVQPLAWGLLALVVVFELFVHPGPYALHAMWAALLLLIIKAGPGSISLDHALGRRR